MKKSYIVNIKKSFFFSSQSGLNSRWRIFIFGCLKMNCNRNFSHFNFAFVCFMLFEVKHLQYFHDRVINFSIYSCFIIETTFLLIICLRQTVEIIESCLLKLPPKSKLKQIICHFVSHWSFVPITAANDTVSITYICVQIILFVQQG